MSQQTFLSSDTDFTLNMYAKPFPFAYELSLASLIGFWQHMSVGRGDVKGALAAIVHKAVQQTPALLEPITDMALIAQHQELVDVLMTVALSASAVGADVRCRATAFPFTELLRHAVVSKPPGGR